MVKQKPAPGITAVEVASSEPPPQPKRRPEDKLRLRDQDWRSQFVVGFKWSLAPLVRDWKGLSLIRGLAIYIGVTSGDLAHDWIAAARESKTELGFAFGAFVIGGFFLAVVTGMGEKYVDKLLTIVGAKIGIALTNPPGPSLTEVTVRQGD